ncbi:MAG TPA: DUF2520 domain-containing protein [Cytophagaceae bacterium]|jgi:predicted short-subunit dehydrogenase-like oxidoreductase (DUF2520 family)|nr:DUF2520 domain-containing protein [Cytophagaceae bacterium]
MASITLIGSGNVAWHFGKAFVAAGHRVDAVYSRNHSNAKALADLFFDCRVAYDTDFSKSNSTVFIIAISDSAIEEVVSEIIIPDNAIIAHISGSMSMEVLSKFSHYGVFYGLQTFTKGKELTISEVPFGIEASDEASYSKLEALALSLSKKVQPINSAQRKVIHIAAVFACNFTNHLFSISESILKKEHLDFSLLESLIKETVQKSLEIGPQKAQTGPAIRGDEKIIQQHLDYLSNEPELQELYKLITNQIKKSND